MDSESKPSLLPPATLTEWGSLLSGAVLTLFVVGHLAGLQNLYRGADALNAYAARLHAMPAVVGLIRFVFTTAFFTHAVTATWVYTRHRTARLQRYQSLGLSWGGRKVMPIMLLTGLFMFAIVPPHLVQFTFAASKAARTGGPSLYDLLWTALSTPRFAAIYVVFALALALHLGFSRVWATVGSLNSTHNQRMEWIARAAALVCFFGFTGIPLYVFLHR